MPPVVLRSGDGRRRHQLLGPVEFGLCQLERGLALIESGNPGVQQSDLVVDVLHGVLQFPALAPGLCFDTAHRGLAASQVRLCGIDGRSFSGDCDLERLLVQFDEKISLARGCCRRPEPAKLAADAGGHERDVTVHIGVVRRNGVEGQLEPRNTEPNGAGQNENTRCSKQYFSSPRGNRLFCGDCARAGKVLRGRRRIGFASRSQICVLLLCSPITNS